MTQTLNVNGFQELTENDLTTTDGGGPLGVLIGGLAGGYAGYKDAKKAGAGTGGTIAAVIANAILGAVAVGFICPL